MSDLNSLLLAADSASLLKTAQALGRKTNKERHWSRLAVILGRVDDEKLWQDVIPSVGSARGYAAQVLEINTAEYFELMALWKVMKLDRSIRVDEWATIPRAKASLVKRVVLGVGGDPREWLEKAQQRGTEELRRLVEGRLGKEPWTTVKVPCSVLVSDLFDEAMQMALPDITGTVVNDPEQIRDRATRAACFERIVAYFIGTYQPGEGVTSLD